MATVKKQSATKTVECTVTVETKAWKFWVSINDKDVKFDNQGKGKIKLPVGPSLYTAWYVYGEHGAGYKITLKAPEGYKVLSIGTHPIERAIPAEFNDSAGTLRLFVTEKE